MNRAALLAIGAAAGWTILCVGPGHMWLMHLVHPVCFAALAIWAGIVTVRLVRTERMRRALRAASEPALLSGVACRVIPSSSAGAFAIGFPRPEIYVGEALAARLDTAELRGVMLHEEHHRQTAAPLRAVAIEAWLALTSRIPVLRGALEMRLTMLEAQADRFALRHGVTPATLARALLKMPAATGGTGFGGMAATRIASLRAAAGAESRDRRDLPWEWAPVAAAFYILGTCTLVTFIGGL
ncbi:MAG: hypothetical protein FIA92_10825 [Chloroflexi bacterium]|nr:hypothetical protein [Chloroflexota bacterium]